MAKYELILNERLDQMDDYLQDLQVKGAQQ